MGNQGGNLDGLHADELVHRAADEVAGHLAPAQGLRAIIRHEPVEGGGEIDEAEAARPGGDGGGLGPKGRRVGEGGVEQGEEAPERPAGAVASERGREPIIGGPVDDRDRAGIAAWIDRSTGFSAIITAGRWSAIIRRIWARSMGLAM